MLQDKNQQTPFSNNNIESQHPNIPKATSVLTGYVANSFNGGHNKTIFYKQIMAGEKHVAMRLKANFKMLTPLTPTYQPLRLTLRTYFVPNSRVWTNAEKFTAQRGGSSEIKIAEVPNLGGKMIPLYQTQESQQGGIPEKYTLLCNTERWRDAYVSSYIPRIGSFYEGQENEFPNSTRTLPKYNALPLRGRKAIFNDFERDKRYDEELVEYKDDTVSETEWESYLPNGNKIDYYEMRAKRPNSYYTDYRTEIQGFESEFPEDLPPQSALINWITWENQLSEARAQAENQNKNVWDIISEMRGSKKLTEGKVQLIGQKTLTLNYSTVTQNTYNNNDNVEDQFRVLGQQGAYSYTEIDLPLYEGMEFIEEGFIHVIATVSADTVFENAFDRNMLNVKALDQYRPELVTEKYDVIYKTETTTIDPATTEVLGFKRKWSELFKLGNVIGGDLTTNNYFQKFDIEKEGYQKTNAQTITQKTFQFFETDIDYFTLDNGESFQKDVWKDYSDFMINKNQAVMNVVHQTMGSMAPPGQNSIVINGQNQIFFVGKVSCLAQLPIDEEIKHNYQTWGEH